MDIRSYRDLDVWKVSKALCVQVCRLCKPIGEAGYWALANQLQKAAISIPSNIAEGRARGHRAEFHQHINIACGSFAELETQLEIAEELGLIKLTPDFKDRAQAVGSMLTALRKSLRQGKSTTGS